MNTNSWIDVELSAVFGGWTIQKSEPVLDGLPEQDEREIMLELSRIEKIVSERRAALSAQSAAKARSFRVLRRQKFIGASV